MLIEGNNCTIRTFREGDEDALASIANDRCIWRNVRDTFPNPYTVEDARWWIGFTAQQRPVTNFAIESKGELAGAIGISLHEGIFRLSGEIGYWIGKPYQGQGIGSEAVRIFSHFAMERFALVRLYALTFEWNKASMRVLEKAGYSLEGIQKKAAIKDNQIIDLYLYTLLEAGL